MSKRASSRINRGTSGALNSPWIIQDVYEQLEYRDKTEARRNVPQRRRAASETINLIVLDEEELETGSSDLSLQLSEYDVRHLKKALKKYKAQFDLSYEDIGKLAGINHNLPRRFVIGEIEMPREETLERYQALVDVFELLYSHFESMPLVRKKVLTTPNDDFEGKSFVDFANELGEDAIFYLRGEVKRMYE